MSTQIKINGMHLVPLKEAARQATYSRDYLAKLAREQKIVATQIGRQWFIDVTSLQNFLDSAALEQEVRKQQLRDERKRELLAKKELNTLSIDTEIKINKTHNLSLAISSIVLFLGFFSGTVMYSVFDIKNNLNNNFSATNVTALSLESKTGEIKVAEPQATTLFTNVTEYPLFVDESSVRKMNTVDEGILLLTNGEEKNNSESLANLFSDQVSVEFTGSNNGYVVYETPDNSVREIPFVSIPNQNTNNSKVNEF